MKKLLLVCASAALACALASADTLTGKLMDNACAQRQQQQDPQVQKMDSCGPTASTTSFALADSTGKIYKLDADGNKKAADAWKKFNSSADRSTNPAGANYQVTATIQGTVRDDEIKVDAIDLH
jgi:hypothetical protein